MEKEYISIREFATRANISRQRAYQLIDKKLKSYCKTIDSKKYIDISALEEIQKGSSPDKSIDKSDKSLDSVLDGTVKPSLQQNAGPADNSCFVPIDKISQSFGTTLDKIVNPLYNKSMKILIILIFSNLTMLLTRSLVPLLNS